ncbi:MAG: hypothetical protein J6Y37_08650, partial [Paludibacteraceae bacterium]|nr:hypothetical protein [Paludibacteraceae bacterium]
ATGTRGVSGPQGANGAQGARGKVLVGSRGVSGPQGANGAQGVIGNRGTVIGPRGVNGPQGANGAQGAIGNRGATGTRGVSGPQGANGAQGPAGLRGSTGAAGVIGSDGTLVNLNQASSSQGFILGKSTSAAGWNGTFYVSTAYFQSGVLYQGSDERWKEFKGDIKVDLDELSYIPKKYYVWNENSGMVDDGVQIGTSAQEVQKLYPEIVSETDGYLSVSYDRLSIIALAAIDKLHEENEKLKKRIEALERK